MLRSGIAVVLTQFCPSRRIGRREYVLPIRNGIHFGLNFAQINERSGVCFGVTVNGHYFLCEWETQLYWLIFEKEKKES